MSLLKQLLISVSLAIIVILAGTVLFSIGSARQYLNTQLQAQSDSTATSLALTLSQPTNQDPAVRELLISVLFDSGEFSVVEFLDPTGRILIRRELGDDAGKRVTAPAWFSHFLPLDRHESQRQVSSGWSQLGVVRLQANDAYARNILWRSTVQIVLLTVVAGILWGLFVMGLMRWLRRALQDDVESRVQAMAEADTGDALPPVRHPRLVELREVSRIISSAHEKVQATASERAAKIESLQLELNQDEITGLANRKYFMNELRRILEQSDPAKVREGHVMLYRQCDLQAINQAVSRVIVDQWLRNMGHLVLAILHERLGEGAWLARLNGSDFAFVMPMVPGPAAVRIAQAVGELLQAQRIQLGHAGLSRWRLALTDFEPGDDLSNVLSRLDEGLMRAESAGHEEVEYLPRADLQAAGSGGRRTGEQAWRLLLRDGLADNWFTLETSLHPVYGKEGGCKLGLLMIQEPGATEPLSGYLFMPAAVRLGMSADCDIRAVELAQVCLRSQAEDLILRVSLASILQENFLAELRVRLDAAPDLATRLIFELDSFALVSNHQEVIDFARAMSDYGVRLGLRRFAEQAEALLYLHQLTLEYVSVSESLIRAAETSPGARHLLAAVVETARETGVRLDMGEVGD